jgi:hypothetical protein
VCIQHTHARACAHIHTCVCIHTKTHMYKCMNMYAYPIYTTCTYTYVYPICIINRTFTYTCTSYVCPVEYVLTVGTGVHSASRCTLRQVSQSLSRVYTRVYSRVYTHRCTLSKVSQSRSRVATHVCTCCVPRAYTHRRQFPESRFVFDFDERNLRRLHTAVRLSDEGHDALTYHSEGAQAEQHRSKG